MAAGGKLCPRTTGNNSLFGSLTGDRSNSYQYTSQEIESALRNAQIQHDERVRNNKLEEDRIRNQQSVVVSAENINGPTNPVEIAISDDQVTSTIQELPVSVRPIGPTVFFTYIKEKSSWPYIAQMFNVLKRKGINTRIDEREKRLLGMSVNAWLNDNIENSHFIIVCVNKLYRSTVSEVCSSTNSSDRNDQRIRQACFIFNQLQTEYITNNCLNFRVLPVLVGGAEYEDVPLFLQNTTVYEWPKDEKQLADRIFKRQMYDAPELGENPTMILEDCRS